MLTIYHNPRCSKSREGVQFLEVTYIVVLFSIVVQGLTVGKVAKKVLKE